MIDEYLAAAVANESRNGIRKAQISIKLQPCTNNFLIPIAGQIEIGLRLVRDSQGRPERNLSPFEM